MQPHRFSALPSLKRQRLLIEFSALQHAAVQGIYLSLTPGDPTLWSGVIFVRRGPYAPAVLRFQISFPPAYPEAPPLLTFSTDIFHPLVTPLTTYSYTTSASGHNPVSASDNELLPPGGFSLRHGFSAWYPSIATPTDANQQRKNATEDANPTKSSLAAAQEVPQMSGGDERKSSSAQAEAASAGVGVTTTGQMLPDPFNQPQQLPPSVVEVLRYVRSTFDDDRVLDSVPLEAAANPGAWHAWTTYRNASIVKLSTADVAQASSPETSPRKTMKASSTTKKPAEWNWDGVWEMRVKRGIAESASEFALFGASAGDDLIRFANVDDAVLNRLWEQFAAVEGH